MVLLIHHPVSPHARKIRALMSEKKMLFILKEEEPWKLSDDVYKLNPAGELPIFLSDGNVVVGNYAITEYLEETGSEAPMISGDAKQRAEIRRITEWFDNKFYKEVYRNIVYEKVHKRFAQGSAPDSKILKVGLNNLNLNILTGCWNAALIWQRTNLRWPTLPPRRICLSSIISATFPGTCTAMSNFGIPRSNPALALKTSSRITFAVFCRQNIMQI